MIGDHYVGFVWLDVLEPCGVHSYVSMGIHVLRERTRISRVERWLEIIYIGFVGMHVFESCSVHVHLYVSMGPYYGYTCVAEKKQDSLSCTNRLRIVLKTCRKWQQCCIYTFFCLVFCRVHVCLGVYANVAQQHVLWGFPKVCIYAHVPQQAHA